MRIARESFISDQVVGSLNESRIHVIVDRYTIMTGVKEKSDAVQTRSKGKGAAQANQGQ